MQVNLATGGQAATDNVATLKFVFGTLGEQGGTEFEVDCHVLSNLAHDVVLGLAFLQQYNPVLDWAAATMRFPQHSVVVHAPQVGKPRIELCSM